MKKTHKTGPLAALKKHPVLAAAVAGAVLAGGYWGFPTPPKPLAPP
ncbi:hypothetical protein [Methylovulum psychrotolerans]|nr:hypothetical protein [Methylovulum psychrotolerans]